MVNKIELRKASMIMALEASQGDVSKACRAVRLARQTHYTWMSTDKVYEKKCSAIKSLTEDAIAGRVASENAKIFKTANRVLDKYGKAGYVYLIECPGFDYYKIGRTSLPVYTRLATIQNGSPFNLVVLKAILVNDCYKLESELHYLFADKRIRGEWFELSREDIDVITKNMCSSEYAQAYLFDSP
jgi:hypothetical protein